MGERATGQNIQDHECPKNNPKNALKQAAQPTIWLVNEVASSGFLEKPQTHHKQSGKKEGRKEEKSGWEARLKERTKPRVLHPKKTNLEIPVPIKKEQYKEREKEAPREKLRSIEKKRKEDIH